MTGGDELDYSSKSPQMLLPTQSSNAVMFIFMRRLICTLSALSVCYFISLLTGPIVCYDYEFGRAEVDFLHKRLMAFQQDTGDFPKTLELMKCMKTENRACASYNRADPWGHEWVYIYPAKYGNLAFDLYSKGLDGKDDFGKNDDISNWNGINYWVYNKKLVIDTIIVKTALFSPFLCLLLSLVSRKKKPSAASSA